MAVRSTWFRSDVESPRPVGGRLPALGCCVVVLAVLAPSVVPHGAGLSPDSATYAAAARSMADGRGYLDIDGVSPMLDFPPLYPALLAGFLAAGMGVAAAGAVIGIGCALGLGGLSVCWARRLGLGRCGSFAVGVTTTLLPPMADSETSTLSEAPFIVFWTAAAMILTHAVTAQRVRGRELTGLTLLLGAACLTRYLGAALVAGTVVALWGVRGRLRRRLLTAGLIGVGAGAPLGLWLIGNRVRGGRFFAPDYAGTTTTFAGHLSDDLRGVGGWFVGDGSPNRALLVGIAVSAIPVVVVVLGAIRPARVGSDLVAVAVVTLVYIGLLLVAQSAVGLDTDDRFMRPVAPDLVLLGAVLLARSRPARRRWLPATAGLLAGGVLAVHAPPAAATRAGAGAEPGDYNSATWRHSALIGALRAHRPQRILVSNDAYAVSLLADLPVESSPTTVFDNSDTPTGESAQFQSDVTDQPRLLAWCDHSEVADLVSLRELARTVCLQPIARYPDGLLLATCGPVPRP